MRIPAYLKRTAIFSAFFGAGLGLGFMFTLILLYTDHPTFIVQDRWRTVTTAPPVTYVPETPFHIDRKVICDPYVPPTTRTTTPPRPVPTTIPPTTAPTPTTTAVP